jgi:hypothetical protein
MMMTTEVSTLRAIGLLQLAYKDDLTKERLRFYVEMLKDIPTPALSAGVKYCINHCKFLPTIAEIRAASEKVATLAMGTKPIDSATAWGTVQKAIASVGYMGVPKFDDPVTQRVVDRFGWKEICQTPVDDTAILRAQFRKAYESEASHVAEVKEFAASGVPVHQKYLADAGLAGVKELTDGLTARLKMPE